MTDNVLVIGSGGREHALSWKLSQSSRIKKIFVAPGNAGTATDSSGKICNSDLNIKNHEEIAEFCKRNDVEVVVVGPEDPLANGLTDYLTDHKIKCFGPCKEAAQIEASKEFAKSFMDRHNIPTARWKSFTDVEEAKRHIISAPYEALVIKASGLAAGKGVIVADSIENAVKAVDSLRQDKSLTSASETIVIEELLYGTEVSVLCFSDGDNIAVMPPAQDHKRLMEGDKGPNTGGMGACCPCHVYESKFIQKEILEKAVRGMKSDGFPYVGVLYAGLMMTPAGPKVLEFNCRFGDPETQVLMPLLMTDLYEIILDCLNGSLTKEKVLWSPTKYAVAVVMVSGGYPGNYPKGKEITGLNSLPYDLLVFHAGTALNCDKVVTSGGRVLAIVAVEDSIQKACSKALEGPCVIQFEGAFYRKDIGHRAVPARQRSCIEGMTYQSAGVNIELSDDLINEIKTLIAKQTVTSLKQGVCGGIGGFGGIFDLKAAGYSDPILVSSGASIGEQLMTLQECKEYEMLGYNLVSSCVNEIICHGAEPLFFLDTFTTGELDKDVAASVIRGIVEGCDDAECALIGGETAEMPGMYAVGDFDLTGFARGAVEREHFLPNQSEIANGDVVIGLLTSIVNSSGFGIIRKLINQKGPIFNGLSRAVNRIHVHSLLPILKKKLVKAAAYINKGGLKDNLSRLLPPTFKINLDASKWIVPDVFKCIATQANFTEIEMMENFNCGIDFVLIVKDDLKSTVLDMLKDTWEKAVIVGSVEICQEGERKVQILNSPFSSGTPSSKIKVAVFTSGKGFNTEALINHFSNPLNMSLFEIALVISDSEDCPSLLKAKEKGIKTKVFSSKDFIVNLDIAINQVLISNGIEFICIDHFSIQLHDNFVKNWKGKIISIHPSLLPAFDSSNPHKEVLNMKARITGCTVYFVEPEKDFGSVIDQAALYTDIDDTEKTLQEKVSQIEQFLYPRALEAIASKRVFSSPNSKVAQIDDGASNFSVHSYGDSLLKKTHSIIKSTIRSGFIETQSACSLFDLKASGYQDPYLVSGTDGVGTKLKIAQICNKHDTIGIDLVAMCVNDILTHGAEPLFFMQSYNCGKLNMNTLSDVISGVAEGCKQANCSLISSEVSELPGIYLKSKCIPDFGNYDVVGYAEGALSKDILLPRNDIQEGDVVIGLSSSGIHSNGYSLVRKIVKVHNLRYQDPAPFDDLKTLGEALLTPTKIYVKSLLPLMQSKYIKAAAHITGGGITENIPRVLPADFKVVIDGQKWSVPPVLKWIAKEGQLSDREMLRTFNCGLGMILIVQEEHEKKVLEHLSASGETATTIGRVTAYKEGEEKVVVNNFSVTIHSTEVKKKKVGVLISGSGTNLQALIDYTQNPGNRSKAEIVLVLSNVPDVEGLKRAEKANIPTKVLSHTAFKSRVTFDMAVDQILKEYGVEIVCLAGFMRILSKEFVQLWQGRLLNVHPAILPAFKGMNAHKLVLEYGARITGCTVHFVEPEVDAGAIIEQAAVRVDVSDTIQSIQDKVKGLEHQIFPKALELLASGRISRGSDGKLVWHY